MRGRALVPLAHPVLAAYLVRHDLDSSAFLADGSLSLIFDAAYRVQVRPFTGERLVMQAQLLDVGSFATDRRGELLVRLLRYAAGTVREFPAGLALDETSSGLVLQQVLDLPIELRQLETALADFVALQAFWRSRCSEEAKRRHA